MTNRVQKQPPEYSNKARKAIANMDKAAKQRIKKGIEKIPLGDIRPLEGSVDSFRLRIGDWRIIFSWVSEEQIFVEKISPRGDAYKGA